MRTRRRFVTARSPRENDSGSVGIIFGLAFVPVIMAAGAAVDYLQVVRARTDLQQATDVATLALTSRLKGPSPTPPSPAEAQVEIAKAGVRNAVVTETSITDGALCASAKLTVSNHVMAMIGLATSRVGATSCATQGGTPPSDTKYEIALVLSSSASMNSWTNGVQKIQAMKTAATQLLDKMLAGWPDTKFSVVPYSAMVVALDPTNPTNRNLPWLDTKGEGSQYWIPFGGPRAAGGQGFSSRFGIFDKLKAIKTSWDWGGCLEGPTYPMNVTDTPANSFNPETLFAPYLSPDDPSGDIRYWNSYIADSGTACAAAADFWGRLTNICKYKAATTAENKPANTPNKYCPDYRTQTLLQLTSDQLAINNSIKNIVGSLGSNLYEGFMWGWRTVSPNAPFAVGRPYGAEKNRKIVVLMADGINAWAPQNNSVTGSVYNALGYFSYNNQKNIRLPDGSAGDGVDYQTKLNGAYNNPVTFEKESREMLDEMTRQACANARKAGVEIFSVGFFTSGVDQEGRTVRNYDDQSVRLMKDCATDANHYLEANDGAQLEIAFGKIPFSAGKLRILR